MQRNKIIAFLQHTIDPNIVMRCRLKATEQVNRLAAIENMHANVDTGEQTSVYIPYTTVANLRQTMTPLLDSPIGSSRKPLEYKSDEVMTSGRGNKPGRGGGRGRGRGGGRQGTTEGKVKGNNRPKPFYYKTDEDRKNGIKTQVPAQIQDVSLRVNRILHEEQSEDVKSRLHVVEFKGNRNYVLQALSAHKMRLLTVEVWANAMAAYHAYPKAHDSELRKCEGKHGKDASPRLVVLETKETKGNLIEAYTKEQAKEKAKDMLRQSKILFETKTIQDEKHPDHKKAVNLQKALKLWKESMSEGEELPWWFVDGIDDKAAEQIEDIQKNHVPPDLASSLYTRMHKVTQAAMEKLLSGTNATQDDDEDDDEEVAQSPKSKRKNHPPSNEYEEDEEHYPKKIKGGTNKSNKRKQNKEDEEVIEEDPPRGKKSKKN